jgi:hypothetical protein
MYIIFFPYILFLQTAMMNFFFIKAIEKKIPVLFETRDRRYYFDGYNSLQAEPIYGNVLKRHSSRKEVLLLHDHQPKMEPRFIEANHCFTIAPMVPDFESYKQFEKHNCAQMFVPIPFREEIIAMNKILKLTDTKDLSSRIDKFGCIPRYVLVNDEEYEALSLRLVRHIAAFDLVQCARSSMLRTGIIPSSTNLSWWIMHAHANDTLSHVSKMEWASEYIRIEVMKHRLSFGILLELESFLAMELFMTYSLYNFSKDYEDWVCLRLSAGLQDFKTYSPYYEMNETDVNRNSLLYKDVFSSITIEKHVLEVLNHEPDESIIDEFFQNKIIQCESKNEALIDALLYNDTEFILFQITIGKDYSFEFHHLDKYMKLTNAAGLKKLRFIFVIPSIKDFHISQELINNLSIINFSDVTLSLEVMELRPKMRL